MSSCGKLGDKKRRRLEARLGRPVLMAFAWGYDVEAVTPEDVHLWVDRDGNVTEMADAGHWTSCPAVLARDALGVESLPWRAP